MIYLYAFIFSGFICLIGEIILTFSKLTPGHITSIFVVFGSILSFLNIYQKLINKFGGGAVTVISNFGHSLYKGGYNGYLEEGIIGIFKNLLSSSSSLIIAATIFSFVCALVFNPKD